MRLLKFLSEELTVADLEKLCPKTANKVDLYRGVENIRGNFGKVIIEKNRTPLNSDIEFQAILNSGFKAVFGIPVRSECVFCTGLEREAKGYGTVIKIYPSDDFTAYWSGSIQDLYALSPMSSFLQINELAPFIAIWCLISEKKAFRKAPSLKYNLDSWPAAKKILEKDFPNYLDNYPESAFKTVQEILKKYPDAVKYFVRTAYQKGNTLQDLQRAAKSRNEVMITGSYYCWVK